MRQSEDSPHSGYRSDIDGLRAVAVLAVLGFHAFPDKVPGGFVGVDVFFIISGYLITGILLDGLRKGTFRVSDFYARRVRRIFPALAVMSAACLAFGWFVLLPDEFAQLGKHVFAGGAFVSNLALWQEAGYFDSASDTKPMLHLWSLGIEEQFYLVWPVFVAAAWKGRAGAASPTVLVAVTSFGLGLLLLARDPSAAFYFPLARFWELSFGGLLALRTRRPVQDSDGDPSPSWALSFDSARSLLGAALIGFPLMALDRNSVFPGWSALPPALGSCLVISAGPQAWLNRVALSSRAMVWIGLISYPLYLWHWPLLTFARILGSQTPPMAERTGLLLLSFVLAAATHIFVERPIRRARHTRSPLVLLGASMVCVGIAGLLVYWTKGVPSRLSDPSLLTAANSLGESGWGRATGRQVDCLAQMGDASRFGTLCRQSAAGPPSLALLGDSHARHLFAGLSEVDSARTWLLLARPGCPPTRGLNIDFNGNRCEQFTERVLERILNTPTVHTVVLSFFSGYLSDTVFAVDHVTRGFKVATISSTRFAASDRTELFFLGLDDVVRAIEDRGKRVIIFMDIPELPFFPRDCLRRSLGAFKTEEACSVLRRDVMERQKNYRSVLGRLAIAHPRLRRFDPLDVLCSADRCAYRNEEILFYQDSHHLGLRGSAWMAERFLHWMSEADASASASMR